MAGADTGPRVLKGPRVVYVTKGELNRRAEDADVRRRAELDEAYRAGVAAGRATGAGAVPELIDALDRAAAELAAAERDRRREDASALVVLGTELARWLVGREIGADPTLVLSLLDRMSEELPTTTALVVHVPVDVVPLVSERWAPSHAATVVGDATLAPGEVRLSTDTGEARLSLDEAFALAREALEGDEG